MNSPRILFIDAYDSFSNNIIALLGSTLDARVTVIRIDDKRFQHDDSTFHDFLTSFDGVVAGPGPGDPRNADDLGLIAKLWSLPDDILLPVFGVCLGFQSLVLAFGGLVERLKEPRHGFVTPISHRAGSLFNTAGFVEATQYHSLHAKLEQAEHRHSDLWQRTETCPDLEPLAWDLSDPANGPILMAVKHTTRPFWGVQYHPESICTNLEGRQVIQNWWHEASSWRQTHPKKHETTRSRLSLAGTDTALSSSRVSMDAEILSSPEAGLSSASSISSVTSANDNARVPFTVSWKRIDMAITSLDTADIVETVRSSHQEVLLLESGTKNGEPVRVETARYSIIGCYDDKATTYRYWTGRNMLEVKDHEGTRRISATMADVWTCFRSFQQEHKAKDGSPEVPFWGGLVGYISYEAGLESINVSPSSKDDQYPDVWFIQVERSIVVDHIDKKLYLQTVRSKDDVWMTSMESRVMTLLSSGVATKNEKKEMITPSVQISGPSRFEYSDKVRACQSHIRAGSSYELCLTDQTVLRYPTNTSSAPDPWSVYRHLRFTNPAPFAAYFSFSAPSIDAVDGVKGCGDDITIMSSSPERFLSWSRAGRCQFRPIKGTVKKGVDMTRAKAEAILKTRKEQAENLMIVDLIRHDLQGALGPRSLVTATCLMEVEEYETVFQLVSVIEGSAGEGSAGEASVVAGDSTEVGLAAGGTSARVSVTGGSSSLEASSSGSSGEESGSSGIQVLAASLPPGSMTGAPKKRSCELLKEIEGGVPRGIYSGVLGYLDVGGGGDFSVVIRTAVQWKAEVKIGAGGAVTALSTPDGEFEEMMAKRDSCLP